MLKDMNWSKIGLIGSEWQLISFTEKIPPKWEKYWVEQRAYWGADAEDRGRFEFYFGKSNGEKKFLEKTQQGYQSFVEFLKYWNGLCKIGENIQVVNFDNNVIVLTKNWVGSVQDHSDLEVWLKQKYLYSLFPKDFWCEIYSFGTISGETIHPFEQGSNGKDKRVSHQKGKDERVVLDLETKTIQISDAVFRIIK